MRRCTGQSSIVATLLLTVTMLLVASACPEPPGADGGPGSVDGGTDEGDGGPAEPDANEPGAEPGAEPEPSVSPEDGGVVDGGLPPGVWRTEPTLPEPRQETAVLTVGNRIYVLGGYDAPPGQQIQDSIYVFDTDSGEWSEGPSLPAAMHHVNAAVVGDEIFVLGSLRASFLQSAECFALDTTTGVWRTLAPMAPDVARGAGVAIALDGAIYVVGGYRDYSSSSFVDVYRVADDAWTAAAPIPDALDHLVGGLVDDTIVIAGGREGSITGHQPKTFVYAAQDDVWTEVAPMPTSRAGAAGAVVGNSLVVIGGEGAANATGVFDEVEAYDVVLDTWRTLESMPLPRHGMGAATVGDRIYVPGGADLQAFAAVATFRSFIVPAPED